MQVDQPGSWRASRRCYRAGHLTGMLVRGSPFRDGVLFRNDAPRYSFLRWHDVAAIELRSMKDLRERSGLGSYSHCATKSVGVEPRP
jgi:hypothetical protein